jgi:hypothetical protein
MMVYNTHDHGLSGLHPSSGRCTGSESPVILKTTLMWCRPMYDMLERQFVYLWTHTIVSKCEYSGSTSRNCASEIMKAFFRCVSYIIVWKSILCLRKSLWTYIYIQFTSSFKSLQELKYLINYQRVSSPFLRAPCVFYEYSWWYEVGMCLSITCKAGNGYGKKLGKWKRNINLMPVYSIFLSE